ncbi:tRNA (guanine-N1)-methyltransferase [Galbibacter pacificus]|uniref:tRNA (Guanine-N1)-methyltransferase n=1 Tax=Galbibacter pacificus TaxID=2996052 RepID=A0ABT6FPX7_9FLAO|nr:tRNA (guanine-N1)-methyltransferase [Galbibacter pacificus]MDG3582380.1 tRNA (guanine-N1)-methyltransferase [Galbibacter pacificus]MDG3585144.1 tRNA (guanine-N1)-methyltransferase [Galbibacter pacificus]
MKMTRKTLLTAITLFLFSIFSVNAQQQSEEEELSLTKGSINNQFEYIFQKANNYQDYKVVKKNWLYLLKKNTLDSVARLEKELAASKQLTGTQEGKIGSLNKELASTNQQLTTVTEEKDSISFFGALINKPAYKGIMWGIVAILALILGLFIYKFKNANVVTQQARKALAELEDEYEEHRRKALEREQKARRQLQDEINKQKLAKSK